MRIARVAGCAAALSALAMIGGCDSIGDPIEAIGARVPPPDEFQVIATKPLQMPPDASLPVPQPGEPSPLEVDPYAEAKTALLGASGSPVVDTASPSAGEQVLLTSANASAASPEIRVQIDEEKRAADAKKPYEPPTLLELLSFTEKKEKLDEKELLDPQVEAERLQLEGQPAPMDPNPVIEDETARSPTETFVTRGRRPPAPFTSSPTPTTN